MYMHTYLSVYLLTYPVTIYLYTYMIPTNLSCLLGWADTAEMTWADLIHGRVDPDSFALAGAAPPTEILWNSENDIFTHESMIFGFSVCYRFLFHLEISLFHWKA